MLKSRQQNKVMQEDKTMEDIKENRIDPKTGKKYRYLETKCEEFEEILVDPNLELLLGIIKGDTSILTKKGHIMSPADQKAKAQLYGALIGLHYLGKSSLKDKTKFKECFDLLQFLGSNAQNLEELMKLFTFKECKHIIIPLSLWL